MTGRAKTLADFEICNKIANLDKNKLLKIGTSPTDVEQSQFQQILRERYESVDRPHVKAKIATVDSAEMKTNKGGCRFLCK